jgi:hypothetical protein
MLSQIICKILKWKKLKGEDKTRIITALLDNIDALPIRDAITFDADGTILIRGKKLEIEQIQNLKTGVAVLKDNFARKLIQEQLLYEANKIGLHQGLTPEMIQFSKAVVWVLENEEKLINTLSE